MVDLTEYDCDAIRALLASGGSYSMIVTRDDIGLGPESELPVLSGVGRNAGFLLPPSMPTNVQAITQVFHTGDSWTRVMVLVHSVGGSIRYMPRPSGDFEAIINVIST